MKKTIAILISILVFATTMFSAIPVYAEIPNLYVSVSTDNDNSFGAGNIKLNLSVKNNGIDSFTVNKIELLSCNFTLREKSEPKVTILTGGSPSFDLYTTYDGKGKTLRVKITESTSRTFTTTIVVEKAILSTVTEPDSSSPSPTPTINKAEIYVSSLSNKILTAGSTVPFRFDIANRGFGYADDIRVMVEGEGDYSSAFSLDTQTGWDAIAEGQEKTRYIRVSSNLKDGAYKLNFKFTYVCNGEPTTQTDSITVYVRGDNSSSPYIKSSVFDKKEIGKDNKAKLTAKLVNPTSSAISNIRISLNSELSTGFSLYENFQPVTISSIDGGATVDIVFSMYVNTSVDTGNYPAVFDISYQQKDGTLSTIQEPIYIQIKRTADASGGESTGKPRIIVSNYSVDVDAIKAGQIFTLDFTLQNTSSIKSVSNIKVVVDSAQSTPAAGSGSGGAVFFPAEGSNSFYIDSIGAKKSVNKQIKLMARQDVEPGVYPVILNLEYDSSGAAQIVSAENISFPVTQEQRLDITGLSIPPESMGGQMIPVNFQYINKGKATIYNFSIEVEGDFMLDGGDVYIGNLTAGYNDYFEGVLFPSGEGELSGALVLKYEDSQGQLQEQRKEFSTFLMPMQQGDKIEGDFHGNIDPITGMPIMEQEKKSGGVLWIIVIGVVLLGGAGTAFIIIRKKRKAKKDMIQDEED